MKNKSLKFKIGVSVLVIVVILGAWKMLSNSDGNGSNEKIVVERGSIAEVVRITGKIVPTNDVDLGFESSGTVARVFADVGDLVNRGASIASLDTDQVYADLRSAEAQVSADEATLQDLINGTRPEEISISEAKLSSNKAKLVDANAQLVDKVTDSYTKSDDAITNKIDQFIDNPRTDPKISFSISDFTLMSDIENGRMNINISLDQLASLALTAGEDPLASSVQAKVYVNEINVFLNKAAVAVNTLSSGSNLSQTTIDAYKADVLSARSNINTALSALLTADEKVRTAESNVDISEQDLALLKAGSTEQQIQVARANVQKSEAAVLKARVQINKSRISSPIKGIVTKQDAEVGQTVTAHEPLVSIISSDNLQLEAQIPEVDIGRVLVGNRVLITIDAFGDQEFVGSVSYIDPAETIIDGVVNFKSNIVFEGAPENLRSGLTSNLFIQTNSKENALIIPQYVILEKDEGTFVLKDVNGSPVESEVELGLRGSQGLIEVISGVSEGDELYNVGLRSN
jgi:multidrug efflux pump subunit AcrA (membrane-fusion protein)